MASQCWLPIVGSKPAPSQPNALAWAEENSMGVAVGGEVHIFDPAFPSSRSCLLCVAASQLTTVYARPSSPYERRWSPVANLTSLLVSEQCGTPLVQCCSWTSLLQKPSYEGERDCVTSAISVIALGGPNTLALVVVSMPRILQSEAFELGVRMDCPEDGVASILLSHAPTWNDSKPSDQRLWLFCGLVAGGVLLTRVAADISTPACRLKCISTARVCCCAHYPVYSLSFTAPSPDRLPSPESHPSSSGGWLLVGSGSHSLLYRFESPSLKDNLKRAACGDVEDNLPTEVLVNKTSHVQPVSSVLIGPGYWLSASADGSVYMADYQSSRTAPQCSLPLGRGEWGEPRSVQLPALETERTAFGKADEPAELLCRKLAWRWLLFLQALSLLPSEAHQSSDRALSLRAADGLISLFLKAAHSPPCKPSLLRPSLPDAMTNAISELYAKESCEAGEAALRAVQRLQQGLDSEGAQISVPAVSPLPKRGVCPICGREVGMESEDEWYVCGSGHRLQRCTFRA
ncbi:MAG: hypothetical protein SGPRY_003927 [Prymnesium sp.]